MKKRNGFTVSEVIITLFLIGVIAMMTIPSVVSDYRKKIYSTSLATAVAGLNSAMTTMIEKEHVNNLLETRAWQDILGTDEVTYHLTGGDNGNSDNFVREISKNIIVTRPRQEEPGEAYRRFGNSENADDNEFRLADDDIVVRSKKGIDYIFRININSGTHEVKNEVEALREGFNYTENAGEVYIDVNGVNNGPNITGRDFFVFDLGADGRLYPYGGGDYNYYHDDNLCRNDELRVECGKDARCCSSYMMEFGYNMDY